ncbi:hypothetical protein GCM10022251_12970 [Phytohabitans flavus]|uniref:Uncharacterized protein n=1 Tax=Phytohabitans flavus TaxID=1076124 RepID=A0A6F8XJA2_9ACTN|nr:hypothetical protein [Phytohabitans flavus]BCB73879.1 hypothetical protein Pflav_002890 [Phytohabitans flavus]
MSGGTRVFWAIVIGFVALAIAAAIVPPFVAFLGAVVAVAGFWHVTRKDHTDGPVT